jgi:hypothetical protein
MSRFLDVDYLRRPAFVIAIAALVITLSSTAPYAQEATASEGQQAAPAAEVAHLSAPKADQNVGKPYYIEFRSRSAQSYGHTFSIYGRLNGGKIASKTVAGLHPFTESPLPWMVGHLVLVPSETGASDGDTEDQYVTARFRVALSQDEYKKVTTFIKDLQKKSPLWHAVLYNCNAFVGDIARYMGLETPSSTMLMPAEYINGLRDLNISRKNVAGMIGTPIKVEDAARLRAEATKALARPRKPAAAAHGESTKSKGTDTPNSGATGVPVLNQHNST